MSFWRALTASALIAIGVAAAAPSPARAQDPSQHSRERAMMLALEIREPFLRMVARPEGELLDGATGEELSLEQLYSLVHTLKPDPAWSLRVLEFRAAVENLSERYRRMDALKGEGEIRAGMALLADRFVTAVGELQGMTEAREAGAATDAEVTRAAETALFAFEEVILQAHKTLEPNVPERARVRRFQVLRQAGVVALSVGLGVLMSHHGSGLIATGLAGVGTYIFGSLLNQGRAMEQYFRDAGPAMAESGTEIAMGEFARRSSAGLRALGFRNAMDLVDRLAQAADGDGDLACQLAFARRRP